MQVSKNTAVAICHVAFEDLGTLADVLQRAGYTVEYRQAGVDDVTTNLVADASLLVVLGGPIGVYEEDRYPFLRDELRVLERRCAQDLPTIGICLGAQLLARCLGAEVRSMGQKEIGFAPVELTVAGQQSALRHLAGVPVLHWHGDTYSLPADAVRLASTPVCAEQAFSYGRRILAVQFHPEWDVTTFERWLVGHAVELACAGIDPRALRTQAQAIAAASMLAGKRAMQDWVAAIAGGEGR